MTSLRVAVWGLGPHAVKNILPAISETRGLELAGVYSRDAAVVAATRARLKCASWDSPDAMLADSNVDVVYVATPIALHAEQGERVLRANKHLWCEKPIVERAAQAELLAAAARDNGLVAAEGFMYLYHSQFRQLSEVVASGRLGAIVSVVCRFGIPPLDRASFRTSRELGGGAFLDVGSYPISAVTALFPDVEPEVLFAEIRTAPNSDVDTDGRALLRFGGASAFLEWRIESAYRSEIDIWGTAGSVATERVFSKPADYVPNLRLLDLGGRTTVEAGHAENHFVTMLGVFRDLAADKAGAERERSLIVRRASLIDRIRNRSQT